MKLQRCQFLFLSSLRAICTGFIEWKLFRQNLENPGLEAVIAANPAKKDLLLRFVSVADIGTGAKVQYAVAWSMNFYYQKNPYNLVILGGHNIYNYNNGF
jgi:hypothetical protein